MEMNSNGGGVSRIYCVCVLFLFIGVGCSIEQEGPDTVKTVYVTNSYTNGSGSVNLSISLDGIPSGETVYLFLHNTNASMYTVSVTASNLGLPSTLTKSLLGTSSSAKNKPVWIDGTHQLPKLEETAWTSSLSTLGFSPSVSATISYTNNTSNYVIGETTKTFWTVDMRNNGFYQVTAVLRAIGTNTNEGSSSVPEGSRAYLYVSTASWGTQMTGAELWQIASKMNGSDGIYDRETSLIGYENGGGAGGDGGIDGDQHITVLFYDIEDGYPEETDGAYVAGYYYYVNEYPESYVSAYGYHSNEKEMFFMDTYPAISTNEGGSGEKSVGGTLSTLIHEFQHMINYNQKGVNESTWLNEGCSMLAEDLLREFVPTNDRVDQTRIPYYLGYPDQALNAWDDTIFSYGKGYAFMAFLARNAGLGVLKEIVSGSGKNLTGLSAVQTALNTLGSDKTVWEAMIAWRESLVYNNPSAPWRGYCTNSSGGETLAELDLAGYETVNTAYTNYPAGSGPILRYYRSGTESVGLSGYNSLVYKGVSTGGTVTLNLGSLPSGMVVKVIHTNE